MCGIIGYIGKEQAHPIIINGLKRIEYRGYDSFGLTILSNPSLQVQKFVGDIGTHANLIQTLKGNIGIGHTRWATHGSVTEENAHPHISNNKKIAVVHNGIVENYVELREFLKKKGFTFKSETDTEVIPNLIEYYMHQNKSINQNNFKDATRNALRMLEGNFAIASVHLNFSEIIGAKNGSPLVVGKKNNDFFLASDVPAFLSSTNEVCYLDDDEMVVINKDAKFFNLKNDEVNKKFKKINWSIDEAEKGSYAHFMIKEIFEQRETIKRAINQDEKKILEMAKLIKEAFGVFFVACGTAAYASQVGAYLFSKISKKHVNAVVGSEFPYYKDFLTSKTLIVAVSQSGETADTITAVKVAKEKGAKVLSLVNVIDSTLMRLADYSFLTNSGPEIGVASTKATTSQIALLTLLAFACDGGIEKGKKVLDNCIKKSLKLFDADFVNDIEKLANKIFKFNDIYVIGRGTNYPIALEAAHKIKEISYIHAEGMAGGELKHGTIALIDKGTPCIAIISEDETKNDMISNANEIKARGGFIIGISPKNHETFDYHIKVPDSGDASPISNLIPAQLLAYFLAIKRGCNPDKPRNLAKSVTVK